MDGLCSTAYPYLKSLVVDDSFDYLPFVSHAAESSPLLETFTLKSTEESYYSEETQRDIVSGSICASVAQMNQLTTLALYTSSVSDIELIELLNGGRDGVLAERLQTLALELNTRDA